jgi:hypothetical protein
LTKGKLLSCKKSKPGRKLTKDLREEAAAIAERERGMAEKSAEFLQIGGRLYV